MNKTFFAVFALLFVPLLPVDAAVQNSPDGAWQVTATAGSGSVGDTVFIDFSVAYMIDSCAQTAVYIQTTDEARQKLSFTGSAVPSSGSSISAERVEWSPSEFEAGVTKKYKVQAHIDRGTVGDDIDGFYFYIYCSSSGKAIYFGVLDSLAVKVVAKQATVSPKPTAALTPTPTTPVTVSAPPATAAPVVLVFSPTPTPVPVNPIDPDGDGLPNDQEAIWGSNPHLFDTDADGVPDGDEVRNGTNPAGDGVKTAVSPPTLPTLAPQPTIPPLPTQPSFFRWVVTGVTSPFRALGTWFSKLF